MLEVSFLSLKVCFNSADPDEMQHYTAFHLGLHCLCLGEITYNAKDIQT